MVFLTISQVWSFEHAGFFGVSRHNFRKKSGSRGLWSGSDCGLQLFRYDFFSQFMQLGGRVSFFPRNACHMTAAYMSVTG